MNSRNLRDARLNCGDCGMLTEYLKAAMRRAHYEILDDDGRCYGEMPACRGVYAAAPTLEECCNELAEVLEDWLLFRIHKHLALPEIDGLELTAKKEREEREKLG